MVNFNTCLLNVQQGLFGIGTDIGGTDNHGHPVNVSIATALTYDLCVRACGTGQEPFSWNNFSQQFSAWLLPWLALISQLPFGANNNQNNLASVLLTVGSPTLAAYSFAITVLNQEWINDRFSRYHNFPNAQNAISIFISLQQAPLSIVDQLLPSLVILPQNNRWWTELDKGLNYTYTWSIAAATSIAWVVIAFVFTVIDSFSSNIVDSINSNGQGVGSLWLWLLPIVSGWLQICPKCDSVRLLEAVQDVNKKVYVVTADGKVERLRPGPRAITVRLFMDKPECHSLPLRTLHLDPEAHSSLRTPEPEPDANSLHLRTSTERQASSLTLAQESSHLLQEADTESFPLADFSPRPKSVQSLSRDEESNVPIFDNSSAHLRSLESLRVDEECTVPIYNYARFFPWVQAVEKVSMVFRAASSQQSKQISVSGAWAHVPEHYAFNDANRVGTLQQINDYCQLDKLDKSPHWGSEHLYRVFIASLLALMLQWGTAGAAIIVNWFTPTVGLGCRSGSYLLYAVLSTIVWMLLLSSSFLTHYCASEGHVRWLSQAKSLSIAFRRVGKMIAALNTIMIISACVSQFTNFFDRCFCNSSVFSLRSHAYNVIKLSPADLSGVTVPWIGGVSLGAASVAIYFGVILLWINPGGGGG